MRKTRVFFVHPRWQMGGVEQTNGRWARILVKSGFEVIGLTWHSTYNSQEGSFISLKNFRNSFALFSTLVNSATRNDCVVICQSYFLIKILIYILFLKTKKVKIVLTERNSFEQYKASPIKYNLYRILYPQLFKIFDGIIVNSEEMKDELVYSKVSSKMLVFRNPRFSDDDIRKLRRIKPRKGTTNIFTFCRWAYQKDTDFLKSASIKFNDIGTDFEVFCGQDDYSFQRPFVESALDYMIENTGIILFCSRFEGYSNMLVEARSAGLPVLYSHCKTGVYEILKNYKGAFEFDKYNENSLILAYKEACSYTEENLIKPDLQFAEQHSTEESSTEKLIEYLF